MLQTTYSWNIEWQKCIGISDLWVLNEIIQKRYPENMKKKSWEPFWSYLLNSTANPAHFTQIGLDWLCYLTGKLLTAPRIFCFCFNILIYFFEYKTIETHARAFLPLIISVVGSVVAVYYFFLFFAICWYTMKHSPLTYTQNKRPTTK